MKLKEPKNSNYAAIIVSIKNVVPLEGADKLHGAIIMGNQVIVDKTIGIGTVGIYFPVECALSNEYLKVNNQYRDSTLNSDNTKKGYFAENGRVKCIKFLNVHKSEGFFMPLESVLFTGVDINDFNIGDEFDELNGIEICRKFVAKGTVKTKSNSEPKTGKNKTNVKMKNLLVDNQFRFHEETTVLYKSYNKITPNTLVHISYKQHGSSGISSYVLVKKQLKWYEKALVKLGVNIPDKEYGYIYSSGKPKSKLPKGIVGKYKNNNGDYYSHDIWKESFNYLKDYLSEGLTLYYEIVGYTPGGSLIQAQYDYGCQKPSGLNYEFGVNYKIAIYRITHTGTDGKVYEYSPIQLQEWCKKMNLPAVYQLYYGYAKDLFKVNKLRVPADANFGEKFMELVKELYNDKDCFMCANKVPEEGCVIRIDGINFNAYKQKSHTFLQFETKQLDKGVVNIEDEY